MHAHYVVREVADAQTWPSLIHIPAGNKSTRVHFKSSSQPERAMLSFMRKCLEWWPYKTLNESLRQIRQVSSQFSRCQVEYTSTPWLLLWTRFRNSLTARFLQLYTIHSELALIATSKNAKIAKI